MLHTETLKNINGLENCPDKATLNLGSGLNLAMLTFSLCAVGIYLYCKYVLQ